MIRAAGLALALGGLTFGATPVLAEGWSITKLGTMPSEQLCMDKARLVINRYIFANGGGSTGEDTWSLYGYDLEPGAQDVVVMCPIGGGGSVNAMMVIQSESSGDDRSWAAQELVAIWNNN
ncbi:hypothetical protein [Maritimibacter sp. HL-12]|uniref:hypothetical protein n=1 Tax=Maritimibacter sp. HL-12 TaxID=1162418 RepID=UPI000A0F09CD|nr:hypothetical protein [Maritimibacter sp. HL-12]SMH31589.1 hypothetical protein SAMN05661107_0257 [Maritimibacter sp. HL-12]